MPRRLRFTPKRRTLYLVAAILGACWAVTGLIGVQDIRDETVLRLADRFSGWREADVKTTGPTSIPDALERDRPLYFVGNGAAVFPFVVRIDVGILTSQTGTAEREYHCWLFGPDFRLFGSPLYHFEDHHGYVHGFDSGTDSIYVLETATDRESGVPAETP